MGALGAFFAAGALGAFKYFGFSSASLASFAHLAHLHSNPYVSSSSSTLSSRSISASTYEIVSSSPSPIGLIATSITSLLSSKAISQLGSHA